MMAAHAADAPITGSEDALQAFRADIAAITGVKVRGAARAIVCGATGCRENDHLTKVLVAGVPARVLCPRHVVDYVNREVAPA